MSCWSLWHAQEQLLRPYDTLSYYQNSFQPSLALVSNERSQLRSQEHYPAIGNAEQGITDQLRGGGIEPGEPQEENPIIR